MTCVTEAIAKLQAILAARGDVRLVVATDGHGPAGERDVEDIRAASPRDSNRAYSPAWRAAIEIEHPE